MSGRSVRARNFSGPKPRKKNESQEMLLKAYVSVLKDFESALSDCKGGQITSELREYTLILLASAKSIEEAIPDALEQTLSVARSRKKDLPLPCALRHLLNQLRQTQSRNWRMCEHLGSEPSDCWVEQLNAGNAPSGDANKGRLFPCKRCAELTIAQEKNASQMCSNNNDPLQKSSDSPFKANKTPSNGPCSRLRSTMEENNNNTRNIPDANVLRRKRIRPGFDNERTRGRSKSSERQQNLKNSGTETMFLRFSTTEKEALCKKSLGFIAMMSDTNIIPKKITQMREDRECCVGINCLSTQTKSVLPPDSEQWCEMMSFASLNRTERRDLDKGQAVTSRDSNTRDSSPDSVISQYSTRSMPCNTTRTSLRSHSCSGRSGSGGLSDDDIKPHQSRSREGKRGLGKDRRAVDMTEILPSYPRMPGKAGPVTAFMARRERRADSVVSEDPGSISDSEADSSFSDSPCVERKSRDCNIPAYKSKQRSAMGTRGNQAPVKSDMADEKVSARPIPIIRPARLNYVSFGATNGDYSGSGKGQFNTQQEQQTRKSGSGLTAPGSNWAAGWEQRKDRASVGSDLDLEGLVRSKMEESYQSLASSATSNSSYQGWHTSPPLSGPSPGVDSYWQQNHGQNQSIHRYQGAENYMHTSRGSCPPSGQMPMPVHSWQRQTASLPQEINPNEQFAMTSQNYDGNPNWQRPMISPLKEANPNWQRPMTSPLQEGNPNWQRPMTSPLQEGNPNWQRPMTPPLQEGNPNWQRPMTSPLQEGNPNWQRPTSPWQDKNLNYQRQMTSPVQEGNPNWQLSMTQQANLNWQRSMSSPLQEGNPNWQHSMSSQMQGGNPNWQQQISSAPHVGIPNWQASPMSPPVELTPNRQRCLMSPSQFATRPGGASSLINDSDSDAYRGYAGRQANVYEERPLDLRVRSQSGKAGGTPFLRSAERLHRIRVRRVTAPSKVQQSGGENELQHRHTSDKGFLCYGRAFLLACANSPFSREPPAHWRFLAPLLPDICISKVEEFFNPVKYTSPDCQAIRGPRKDPTEPGPVRSLTEQCESGPTNTSHAADTKAQEQESQPWRPRWKSRSREEQELKNSQERREEGTGANEGREESRRGDMRHQSGGGSSNKLTVEPWRPRWKSCSRESSRDRNAGGGVREQWRRPESPGRVLERKSPHDNRSGDEQDGSAPRRSRLDVATAAGRSGRDSGWRDRSTSSSRRQGRSWNDNNYDGGESDRSRERRRESSQNWRADCLPADVRDTQYQSARDNRGRSVDPALFRARPDEKGNTSAVRGQKEATYTNNNGDWLAVDRHSRSRGPSQSPVRKPALQTTA